ncbi:LysR family transcriptional regulator [Ihubacter sp. mB4P-1]|uniref:LysR family transcriptional regulator n=1 Tax=Ihubacter sp. mB4P-1 TaxID=3242370 RepID=UPI003C7E3A91
MEIRQIYYVMEVAKHQSFSKAAAALFISQPAISQQIHGLEEELQTKLFKRDTHSVLLTAEGEKFCSYAKDVVTSIDRLMAAFGQSTADSKTVIRTGVFPFYKTAGLMPVINDFFAVSQNVIGSIKVVDNYRAYEMLENGELDFAIIKCRENNIRPSVRHEVLTMEHLNVLINRENPMAKEPVMKLENLGKMPLLTGESDSHFYNEMKELYQRNDVPFNVAFMNTQETEIMVDMLRADRGILMATDRVAGNYEDETIAVLPIVPVQEFMTALIWPKHRRLTGAYLAFKNYVVGRFR